MRKIIVSGRVVNDAEKKMRQNGSEYIQFRFANNDYSGTKTEDGKPVTYWYNVTSRDAAIIARHKYLTKGKPLIIDGQYFDNIYQNKNTGNYEIGRNIIANSVDFDSFSSPSQNDGNNASSHTQSSDVPQTQTSMSDTPTQQNAQNSTASSKDTPAQSLSDSDDDLPF